MKSTRASGLLQVTRVTHDNFCVEACPQDLLVLIRRGTATSNRVLRVRYVALGTHRNYLIDLIRRHLPESLHLEYDIESK